MNSDSQCGVWTYLFTDVEGSTRLWAESEDAMRAAMARHDEIARETFARHGSRLHKERGEGDSLFVTFQDARSAVDAALAFFLAIHREPWELPRPIRVRAALHTGHSEFRDGDYYGNDVNLCARMRGLAHGGQIVASEQTISVLDVVPQLVDLGFHRMKDVDGPRHIFQISHSELSRDFPPLRGLKLGPSNLPTYSTRFFGRNEVAYPFVSEPQAYRLVSFIGPGGCGKTRLATELAGRVRECFPAGVWFVDAMNAKDSFGLELALRVSIGLGDQPETNITDQLKDHWPDEPVLVVFDNVEQCVEDAALLIENLLRLIPRLCIWTTSRETLDLDSERVVQVDPLPLPSSKANGVDVMSNPSVQLFFDRAGLVEAETEQDVVSLSRVRSIVGELDGIPLAIELAAARLKTLDLSEIESQLRNRMELLSKGRRTNVERQRTIENAISWSYDLLSSEQQLDFVALSVVPGLIDEPLACAILAEQNGHERAESLARASLLQTKADGCFQYLRTIREFANRQLDSAEYLSVVRSRFGRHYSRWCADQENLYQSGEQQASLKALVDHYDNIREVVMVSVESPDVDINASCAMVRVLARHWRAKGFLSEGNAVIDLVRSSSRALSDRARFDLAIAAGTVFWRKGELPAATSWFSEALSLSHVLDDKSAEAQARNNLGLVAQDRGDFVVAENHHAEALRIRTELGSLDDVAASHNNLGLVAWQRGFLDVAEQHFNTALETRRKLPGLIGRANALTNLALVNIDKGHFELAQDHTEEAIGIFSQVGDSGALLQARFVRADAQYALGQIKDAREEYENLLKEYAEIGDDWAILACRLSIADVVWRLGEEDQAAAMYIGVLERASQVDQWSHVAHACVPLAAWAGSIGKAEAARLILQLHDNIASSETLHASWHCPINRESMPPVEAASLSRSQLLDEVLTACASSASGVSA